MAVGTAGIVGGAHYAVVCAARVRTKRIDTAALPLFRIHTIYRYHG
jgi:hypothetical protein